MPRVLRDLPGPAIELPLTDHAFDVSRRATRLDEIPPEEVLRRIRRRKRAGLAMTTSGLNGDDLLNLARFHFGGWYEAVAAAGLKPEGRPALGKQPGRGYRRLRPLSQKLLRGPCASSELERITGVRASTIRDWRRGMGIVRDERRKKDRSWLPAVRRLLGKAPDKEIAKRVGVGAPVISGVRKELGIPIFVPEGRSPEGRSEPLDRIPPREVLRRIRARARTGKSMRASDVVHERLRALADFHFGGWYEAVEAAGLAPAGAARERGPVARPKRLRKLTPALLEGPLPSRELERLTGIPRRTVRARREQMGIQRDERPRKERAWVKGVAGLFGKIPDAEIARRTGVTTQLVGRVRQELGIQPCTRRSLATSDALRERLEQYEPDEIAVALKKVGRRAAAVLRNRVLASEPETLDQVGARFGITSSAVLRHERRGLVHLLAELERRREQRDRDHGRRRRSR